MLQSHVIEVNGVFIGAAVPAVNGVRFRAVHPQVEELDDSVWGSLAELRQATAALFRTGRLGAGRELAARPDPWPARNAAPPAL